MNDFVLAVVVGEITSYGAYIVSGRKQFNPCLFIRLLADDEQGELDKEKDNMRLDEAAWFSMGSLLGQGTDHQPKPISGTIKNYCMDEVHQVIQIYSDRG